LPNGKARQPSEEETEDAEFAALQKCGVGLAANPQVVALAAKAAGQRKRKGTTEPFVKMPIWLAEVTARATKSPALIVLVEILRLHWRTGRATFPVPNVRLRRQGVSRKAKLRVLGDMERAGLLKVERSLRRSVVITLSVPPY
jgi:hypothetical protein